MIAKCACVAKQKWTQRNSLENTALHHNPSLSPSFLSHATTHRPRAPPTHAGTTLRHAARSAHHARHNILPVSNLSFFLVVTGRRSFRPHVPRLAVSMFLGRRSWTVHRIPQGERGEEGDPLMLLPLALGQHRALEIVRGQLVPARN